MTREEEFLERLRATFRVEAGEILSSISAGLIELEKRPSPARQAELLEVVYRSAHSLKGAARAVSLNAIEALCQAMENIFSALKRGEAQASPAVFDSLHAAADLIRPLALAPAGALQPEEQTKIQAMENRLADAVSGKPQREPPPPAAAPDVPPEAAFPVPRETAAASAGSGGIHAETVRIPMSKLDALVLKAEELISAKLSARLRAAEMRKLKAIFGAWAAQWDKAAPALRKAARGIEAGGRTASGEGAGAAPGRPGDFFEWNSRFAKSLEERLDAMKRAAEEDSRSTGGMVDDLLGDIKEVMMLPFSSALETFPRLVRDIAREQGKLADLTIEGGEIEIDKRVLQLIKDPLSHLVRNCIDHGLETPESRRGKGKPEKGSLKIAVSQIDSGRVEVLVSDDGKGIDAGQVKASAVKYGILSGEEAGALSDRDAIDLIFKSGVSTSPLITELSGRGLGLAIVRENAEKLGGTAAVETSAGGTLFRLVLPLSIATFRGITLEAGGRAFIVPTKNVAKIISVSKDAIKSVENRETILFNSRAVSLARLADVLELPAAAGAGEGGSLSVMLLGADGGYMAFVIDRVLAEDEVLFKNLGRQFARVRNIAGATVVGSGLVVPILNVADLMKSARKYSVAAAARPAAEAGRPELQKQSVLVVEDSITARTLMVNILESAGYGVVSAVDGVDGLVKFGGGDFDIIVTDIAMPNMNGFDLTAKIREGKKRPDIPIVIVTGLESPEDKRRGIEAGASAYIVKSSFDQSNLLEVIKRLI